MFRRKTYKKPSGTRQSCGSPHFALWCSFTAHLLSSFCDITFTLLHAHRHLSETVIRRLTSLAHRAATPLTVPPAVTMAEATQELHQEIPLSIQTGLQFKFHVLLECSEWRMTTLGHGSLQFITKTQKIVDGNGRDFQHPLTKNIWEMVLKCTRLGDGDMITVLVPFNDTTGEFDLKTPNATKKNANL